MKKLFTAIDKLIADIPDDKGAWEKAIEIFSKHQEYGHMEMKRGMYFREYKALTACLLNE